MAYGDIKTFEDYAYQQEINKRLWGKASDGGAHYKRWREKYERDLAEAESWLRTNPQNTVRQAEVARLKKLVADYRRWEDMYP